MRPYLDVYSQSWHIETEFAIWQISLKYTIYCAIGNTLIIHAKNPDETESIVIKLWLNPAKFWAVQCSRHGRITRWPRYASDIST